LQDNGVCQSCKIICLLDVNNNHPYKINFDHIFPIEFGGTNEISNGQILCLSCHKLKHSSKAKTANSVKPNLEESSMAIPSQAPEKDACVETNVQSSKEMI
jgi:5-methylcytosine-specific restriction endonuclease McrA